MEAAQTRREDLAKAESQRAGLSTFVEIEESQEILSTSSEEEASDAPVAKPPGGAAMAEYSESDLSVNVVNAENVAAGGGNAPVSAPSPSDSSSTIVSVARSAASLTVSQALQQLPEDGSASFTTISSYALPDREEQEGREAADAIGDSFHLILETGALIPPAPKRPGGGHAPVPGVRAKTATIADAQSALPVHAGKALVAVLISPPGANAISLDTQDVAALFSAVIIIRFTTAGMFGAGIAVGCIMARLFESCAAESSTISGSSKNASVYHLPSGGGNAPARSAQAASGRNTGERTARPNVRPQWRKRRNN